MWTDAELPAPDVSACDSAPDNSQLGADPIEQFFSQPELTHIRLSPDGEHLAGVAPGGCGDRLVILTREPIQVVKEIRLRRAMDFWWVSEDRLLLRVESGTGPRLVAIDRRHNGPQAPR